MYEVVQGIVCYPDRGRKCVAHGLRQIVHVHCKMREARKGAGALGITLLSWDLCQTPGQSWLRNRLYIEEPGSCPAASNRHRC